MRTWSAYEAKAKFSELLRQVREGQTAVITLHGKPVAEVRPIAPKRQTLDERLEELERRGALIPATVSPAEADWRPLAHRPGALKRFLDERD